eukprot:TRINITY_DN778114_c0_g1_i1.p1 TRINITY_DN778114_c0_g1~~TRINITY_DN778114_c0_g1_i1.p1  ORF type:complete len:147 (-),score=41.00 TRINITY_DN778114_c0_g1_i1:99-539(-)
MLARNASKAVRVGVKATRSMHTPPSFHYSLKGLYYAEGVHHHVINVVTAVTFAGCASIAIPCKYINKPMDYVLAAAFPIFAQLNMVNPIVDYVPLLGKKAAKIGIPALRMTMTGVSLLTFMGLMKLNICGPGITETMRNVFKVKEQ